MNVEKEIRKKYLLSHNVLEGYETSMDHSRYGSKFAYIKVMELG